MYCFDTDVLSAALKRDPPLRVVRRFALVPADEQFTTSITLAELLYGAVRRADEVLAARVRDLVLTMVAVLPFDEAAAEEYGRLRADLEARGQRLGEPDLCIASIALARKMTLVTANVRHFSRVRGLDVENWLAT